MSKQRFLEIDPLELRVIPVHKEMHFGHVLGAVLNQAFPDLSPYTFTDYTFSVDFNKIIDWDDIGSDTRIYRFNNFILKRKGE